MSPDRAEAIRKKLMSNVKLAEVLTGLGVEAPMKLSPAALKRGEEKWTHAFSKTDQAFKDLLEHPNEIVRAIVEARLGVKSTQEETRTEAFIGIQARGTMPVPLKYWGAHTGRASGQDGINLQNLGSESPLRKAIQCPEGHMMIESDASQIEARILGWLAGQDDLVAAFGVGEDIYSLFASDVYGRPITRADVMERFTGKTCVAEGTPVLCVSGWKPVEQVTTNDKVWDGQEWVCHSGLVPNGLKETLSLCGLWLTPDHLVWSGTQWLDAQSLHQDASILCQSLDTAAASLPLPDTSPARTTESESLRRRLPVYDIASAGPRHRFTVLTDVGPLIVHNCILGLGFGTGADKLRSTLKMGGRGQVGVEMSQADCERIVDLYRHKYDRIVKLWGEGTKAIKAMVGGYEYELGVGIKLRCVPEGVHLPNGTMLRFHNLRRDGKKYVYDGRKGPEKLYGAKLIENIVQALARCITFNHMCLIDQKIRVNDSPRHRFKVVLTVHDSVAAIFPSAAVEKVKAFVIKVMSKAPKWAAGLPLACEAKVGLTYGDLK